MENTNLQSTDHNPTNAGHQAVTARGSLVAGLVFGLSASACCAGPLVLLMLGVSGSWIGNLSALEPLRPFFILAAVIFIGLAYRKIYRQAKHCDPGAVCATQEGRRSQRIMFWLSTLIIVSSIAFPWYGPLLFE